MRSLSRLIYYCRSRAGSWHSYRTISRTVTVMDHRARCLTLLLMVTLLTSRICTDSSLTSRSNLNSDKIRYQLLTHNRSHITEVLMVYLQLISPVLAMSLILMGKAIIQPTNQWQTWKTSILITVEIQTTKHGMISRWMADHHPSMTTPSSLSRIILCKATQAHWIRLTVWGSWTLTRIWVRQTTQAVMNTL
jgi:hypothetical protein